ncbi:hypothetical protein N7532_010800 [Penicillium argentinense]|uniref:Calponin-homology (CH) domain-containing protein n=1 Tax=Penicillium argentinense TaxID=1131581 RepID=A0A9W9EQG7_9EURO|nr:uncharacterized protein N7532_010800 [Penicillium argentinense]KAJ5086029.1 hypothetical protein N7532_010800 [Penicillium argentinense]
MSGLLEEAFTPCPSRSRSSGFGDTSGSETFDSFMDDSVCEATDQIDFTTEIRAPVLTGARPRRANRTGSTFHIHDDPIENRIGPVEKRRRPNSLAKPQSDRKSSLLAQPALRFRPKVNFAQSPPTRPVKQDIEPQPKLQRRDKTASEGNTKQHDDKRASKANNDDGLKRNVRRDTVYIPPDDTTVASVFMGLFSPLKKQRGNILPNATEDTQVNTLESQIAKRQARKSMAASARRAPLQPSAKIAQETASRCDIPGKNGGKENVPPGTLFDDGKKQKAQSNFPMKSKSTNAVSAPNPIRRTTVQQPMAQKTTSNRSALGEKNGNSKTPLSTSVRETNTLAKPKGQTLQKSSASLNARASALSGGLGGSRSTHLSRMGNASSKRKDLNLEYPVLTENTAKPALYEENWLSHQETVITQLVNALLECTNGDSIPRDPNPLRLELLELYHTEYFARLHQRLQASLSCGTLSIPKDLISRHNRLRQDVGLRRRFLDIWIQSYDLRALVPAVETVVGRQVSNDPGFLDLGSDGSVAYEPNRVVIRKLEGFLEAFILRNEDIDQTLPCSRDIPKEMQARAYRRTVLRSILLVVLLDEARQCRGTSLPRQLFVPSSPFKSSVEVLQSLARVLLPSCGDMAKPLSHIGCCLSYKQHQLQEYSYQMDNLAVDLRDGVRLTRIVEILFFTSEHVRSDAEDQMEVTLYNGDALSLLGDETDLPLSKHLKFPCISRAAKLYNVQIALSALSSIQNFGLVVRDTRPEDIVDGYREKTIALLWALVSNWGLAGLIDWDDARKEITRLKKKAFLQLGPDKCHQSWLADSEPNDNDEYARVLRQWASILAALKGLHIANMTTSFANGKVYESIINEYEPYIIGNTAQHSTLGNRQLMSLESRLRLLGCSSQFAQLVSPKASSSHILDGHFTLGVLAFLCSRLLSASKHARAATVLQRTWRAHLVKRDAIRRAIAQDLAANCAAVVQTRNEILWAKEVITRWWRNVKAHRQYADTVRYPPRHKTGDQSRGAVTRWL